MTSQKFLAQLMTNVFQKRKLNLSRKSTEISGKLTESSKRNTNYIKKFLKERRESENCQMETKIVLKIF